MSKKRGSFKGKVSGVLQKEKNSAKTFGYLNLPKDISMYLVEDKAKKATLDLLPYEVTDSKHPDNKQNPGVAVKGDLWWRRPFKIHRNVGGEDESVVCLKSIGKACPICEEQYKLFKAGTDKEETKAMRAKDRYLYIVVPLGSKKYEEVPHIWDVAKSLFQDELTDSLEEDDSHDGFAGLEDGETLTVNFKWKTLGTNTFPETKSITFSEREEQYDESILDNVPNLDEVLKILTYKELFNKFFEMDDDAGELDDVDDYDDKVKTLRRKKKLIPVVEDEDEEEDEDDKPVRRKKSQTTKRPTESKECPFGHRFGRNNDKFDECDDCELFNDCYDEKNK